jgi:hypothetical protein
MGALEKLEKVDASLARAGRNVRRRQTIEAMGSCWGSSRETAASQS